MSTTPTRLIAVLPAISSPDMPSRYQVVDNHDGRVIATYSCPRRARARANRMDTVYGAVRYIVRPVW